MEDLIIVCEDNMPEIMYWTISPTMGRRLILLFLILVGKVRASALVLSD